MHREKRNTARTLPVPCVLPPTYIFHTLYIYALVHDSYQPMHLPHLVIDIITASIVRLIEDSSPHREEL